MYALAQYCLKNMVLPGTARAQARRLPALLVAHAAPCSPKAPGTHERVTHNFLYLTASSEGQGNTQSAVQHASCS